MKSLAFEALLLVVAIHLSSGVILKSNDWVFEKNGNVGAQSYVYPNAIWVTSGEGSANSSAIELSQQVATISSGSAYQAEFNVICDSSRSFEITLGEGSASTVQCDGNWGQKKVFVTAGNGGKALKIQLDGSKINAMFGEM